MTSKANFLLHPGRMQLVVALSERPQTAQELGRHVPDMPQATIYRHLNHLLKAGIVQVVEERRVHSNQEKVYGLVAEAARLTAHDIANASAADHERFFAVFMSHLLQRFGRYVHSTDAIDYQADGVSYNTGTLYLTDAELETVKAGLREILGPYLSREAAPEFRRRCFATIVFPDLLEDAQ